MEDLADIVSLKEFQEIKFDNLDIIVCTSMYADPLTPGHIDCLVGSKRVLEVVFPYDYTPDPLLIVIINGDTQARLKKGKPFMDLRTRCKIVSAISGVDYVIPFEPSDPEDPTVCEALEIIKPHYFTKGGDRVLGNIPEEKVCKKHKIELVTGIGGKKTASSSNFLKNWEEFVLKKKNLRV